MNMSWEGWPEEPVIEHMHGWRLIGVYAALFGGSYGLLAFLVWLTYKVIGAL